MNLKLKLCLSVILLLVGLKLPAQTNSLTASEYNEKGIEEYNNSNYSAAVNYYSKAINLAPSTATYWYNRGLAYYYDKNYSYAKNLQEAKEWHLLYSKR